MQYRVMFVEDSALPPRQDWALARQGSTTMLFIKRGAADEPKRWEAAWRGANLLANQRLEREHGLAAAL